MPGGDTRAFRQVLFRFCDDFKTQRSAGPHGVERIAGDEAQRLCIGVEQQLFYPGIHDAQAGDRVTQPLAVEAFDFQRVAAAQIPQETKGYVLSIVALAAIGENPKLFGFVFDPPLPPADPAAE